MSRSERVLSTHAAIWSLFVADDGEQSMAYDGALIRCANCDGWEGLECPQGCGVVIFSNQAERDAKYRQEMAEHDLERKARRAERKRRLEETA